MVSCHMQRHMGHTLVTNNWCIWGLLTKWTDTNQSFFRLHFQGLCASDFGFIWLEWCGILSCQYTAKRLSYWKLDISIQSCEVKFRVLLFFGIVEASHTQWVYQRALSLALGDMNLFVENLLQISSYSYEESPIAIMLWYEYISWWHSSYSC